MEEGIMDADNIQKGIVEEKNKTAVIGDEEIVKERKEKVIKFLKEKYNLIVYFILALIVFIGIKIRTSNVPYLKDVTTGTWTLGPDLDPFLFNRWAEYIIEHGSLFAVDPMRYVPFGFETKAELLLHPYMMVWFHKIAVYFGSESVTHSSIYYPVFMFALTAIAIFLFSRKVFIDFMGKKKASIIGLVSAFFVSVIPALLHRTIAGIPEKESPGFLFMVLTFYLFLSAWKAKKTSKGMLLAVLAGASTAAMALSWGGYIFILVSIGPAAIILFLVGKINKQKFYLYAIWLLVSFMLMAPFSIRYDHVGDIAGSIETVSVFLVLFILAFDIFIFEPRLKKYFEKGKLAKVPKRVISLVISLITIIAIISVLLGPSFITSKATALMNTLITPASSRFQQTVAENRQPFFNEWAGNFGPGLRGVPVFFWLFFVGSVYLFYQMFRSILSRKERINLTVAYIILLFSIIFSRYSPESTLNGTSSTSLFVYAFGILLFLGAVVYYYYAYEKRKEEHRFTKLEEGIVLLFTFFFISLIAARSSVRTVMVLVPSVSVIGSYFVVAAISDAEKVKDKTLKMAAFILAAIVVLAALFSGWGFYKAISSEASMYAPSTYTQQWQNAMAWVRNNTQGDAVFAHWWDYGYWVQSIGERATVLDGGNAQGYWNHMMGRHALTGRDNTKALEFLYAHNTTHFLIDSTDIGKYTAFSGIGSDVNYDRRSWIQVFLKDDSQVRETKNSTVFVYSGGTVLDGDVIYEENETKVFLPGGKAGIGAVLIERNSSGEMVSPPKGIFVYQGAQYTLPLKYAHTNGRLIDFGSGVEAGIFIFPRITGESLDRDGAMLYLTDKTVKSQLARLYLYKEDNPNFKIAHIEDDSVVKIVKQQYSQINNDFVYFNGLRGPITIWEIKYPDDIKLKEEYLETSYPAEIL